MLAAVDDKLHGFSFWLAIGGARVPAWPGEGQSRRAPVRTSRTSLGDVGHCGLLLKRART